MSDITAFTHTLRRGSAPLLVSIPHLGTRIPHDVRAQMTDVAELRQDTDWHLDRLYEFVGELDASVLQARISRYAIDLNRPPNDDNLYPGRPTTGLCPTETFQGEPLYRVGCGVAADERERRLRNYWLPYHTVLRAELDRLRSKHGAVLLWEAHSIASRVPRLFDGRLPDFNFGTDDGRACGASLVNCILTAAAAHPFGQVLNGRFKGGYITRHYGAPVHGIHALQLEMCQCLYMNECAPFEYLPESAARVQGALRGMLAAALAHLPRLC